MISWKFVLHALAVGTLIAPALLWAADNTVRDRIETPVQQSINTRQVTQQNQEAWQAERERRTALYASLQQEKTRLEKQRTRLQEEQNALLARIVDKRGQLARSEEIADQIAPYLEEMLAKLRERIDTDHPFLETERRRRTENLENLLSDPGVTVSEKFRKTMEALTVEAEYGRTIEVYQDTITVEGQSLLVTIFRLGRIGLFYQTLDHSRSGMFDVAANAWTPLPSSFDSALRTATDIAAKRQPTELLHLPIGRIATP